MRKIVKRTLLIFLSVLLVLIVVINIPVITLRDVTSNNDYSNWMAESVDDAALLVNIAMPGAHDAFSNEINYSSELDPYLDDGIFKGIPGSLLKGFLVKQSVTQTADVNTLLSSGVRYLDVRLSLVEDKWYTKHNYLSGDFEDIAKDITAFLEEYNGEFLILDFQHINGVSYDSLDDYNKFVDMLNDFGLLDYAYITDDLSTVTYGDITIGGTESKVILIAPFEDASNMVYNYDESIRSVWANEDEFALVTYFLETEAESSRVDSNKFRVMQAVTTMQTDGNGIINALSMWSLVNRANEFNTYLLEYGNFEELLDDLPIVMLDNTSSNKSNFIDDLMEIIIEYNSK